MARLPTLTACAVSVAFALGACASTIDAGDEDATETSVATSSDRTTTDRTTDEWEPGYCEVDMGIVEVPQSVIEQWLDEDGEIALEDCAATCNELDFLEIGPVWLIDCEVVSDFEPSDDADGTTGGTGDATTGSDTGGLDTGGGATDGDDTEESDTNGEDTDERDTDGADSDEGDTGGDDTDGHDPLLELSCTWEACWGGAPEWDPAPTEQRI